VRADAEGLFVPLAELPHATIGDVVVVEGPERDAPRSGIITATTEADDDQFFRVKLDPS
jgi:hypothetical protein